MQAQIARVVGIVGIAAVAALGGGYATLQLSERSTVSAPPPAPSTGATIDPRIVPPPGVGQGAPPPLPIPHAVPMTEGPIQPEPQNAPPLGGGYAPPSPSLPAPEPNAYAHGSGPSAMPPLPPAGAADPPSGGSAPPSDAKVLSYFQHSKTSVDTKKAFGFVLLPRAALTAEEKQTQKDFCDLVLASMDFLTPGAVAEVVVHHDILVTYWPIETTRNSFEVGAAFAARDCNDLIAWYDHAFARRLAAKAGVGHLGGPLLITWPSSGANERDRNPLVVDFSKANHARAVKALQYWFRELRNKPSLWTNRIREGTIRAELADAVNDTAGVVLAVLSGKWDSFTPVATSTP